MSKRYSRYTSLGVLFAGIFDKSIRKLPKKLVFEKGDGKWIDVLPILTKQYNNRIHSSAKLILIQGSMKNIELFVYQNLLDKRKNIMPKYKIHDLIRTPVLRKTISKTDTTNWSYKLSKITEVIHDRTPNYPIDNLQESYSKAFLKKRN